ncbi:hypothetical protein AXF42_Ash012896 [Apostasia shenzhenica]|uniref:Uncharacterized protein n=1 Tax=Apostasia shenzhenica TaxID=1088818 RepID=A0A2I0ARJ8_9ASPA|nr:hypothetical protein AXF42_Ash012896 [Apostasia shenzhenica]
MQRAATLRRVILLKDILRRDIRLREAILRRSTLRRRRSSRKKVVGRHAWRDAWLRFAAAACWKPASEEEPPAACG